MREERTITIDGQVHIVVISDEKKALLDAAASGRAIIGFWDRSLPPTDLSPAQYVVECPEDVDDTYLEQVVRRKLGLPWIIGETERLLIREFTMDDIFQVVREEGDTAADEVFAEPEKLREYIRCQYGFYEYGIWALVRKSDGQLVGKAGVTNVPDAQSVRGHQELRFHQELRYHQELQYHQEPRYDQEPGVEMGYHIFHPYRNRGYAVEACQEILTYASSHLDCPIYAKIDASNEASIRVAVKCGFQLIQQIYSESGQCSCLFLRNC